MKHRKHAKLTRPKLGFFGREEWAIIGTPCPQIQALTNKLIQDLHKDYQLGYVDADHQAGEPDPILQSGAALVYTDKITHHRLDWTGKLDTYQYRPMFRHLDGILVNGNHFVAKRQIVVIDPVKEASLRKKLDRLTKVVLFLLADGVKEIPAHLKEAVPNWHKVPTWPLQEYDKTLTWLKEELASAAAPLAALVLAGGKSTRMGKDKGALDYHGKPQREYLADLLNDRSKEVCISCRSAQQADFETEYSLLIDSFLGLGPFGAILSAFRRQPNWAWLTVACDLPLVDGAALDFLITRRNPSKLATAFYNPATDFPDPLLTIWEPRAYPTLLQFLAQGYSCPRKVLINSDIEILHADNPAILRNVNTPEDLALVKDFLKD